MGGKQDHSPAMRKGLIKIMSVPHLNFIIKIICGVSFETREFGDGHAEVLIHFAQNFIALVLAGAYPAQFHILMGDSVAAS